MALSQVNAGDKVLAANLNQYYSLVTGGVPDQVLTPLAWGDRYQPVQFASIATGGSTIYTVPSGYVAILTTVRVHNKTASGVTIAVSANGRPIVKSADSLGTVPSYMTLAWNCFRVLAAATTITATAGTASALDCDLDLLLIPTGYVGVNFRAAEGSSLSSGTQTLFTTTSGKVAVVRDVSIENSSTAQTVIIQKYDGTNAYELDRQNVGANQVYRLPGTIAQVPVSGGHSIRAVLTQSAGNYAVGAWETM
jgi:hypothetical protein